MARKKKRSGKTSSSSSDSKKASPEPRHVKRPTPLIPQGTSVTKIASLLVLVVIIILISILFYRVMANFVLPLFLAAMSSVLFRPIHKWMLDRFQGRETIAAGMTTAAILGIVLCPLVWIASIAVGEAIDLLRGRFDSQVIVRSLNKVGNSWPLNLEGRPFEDHVVALDKLFADMPKEIPDQGTETGLLEPLGETSRLCNDLREQVMSAHDVITGAKEDSPPLNSVTEKAVNVLISKEWIAALPPDSVDDSVSAEDENTVGDLPEVDNSEDTNSTETDDTTEQDLTATEDKKPSFLLLDELIHDVELAGRVFQDRKRYDEAVRRSPNSSGDGTLDPAEAEHDLAEIRSDFPQLNEQWRAVRSQLHGGSLWMTAIDTLFPSPEMVSWADNTVRSQAGKLLPSISGKATAIAGQLIGHLAIMILGLFYFLKDGPGMIRAVMHLSPLDDRYEEELLLEFDTVSRAVVSATILSAVAQGLLAGIGYYFVDFNSVLLLTMLTMVMAMVPVVGAASVWVPACIWLAIVDEKMGAAIGLAIYGMLVVSMIDNLIKPFVLHGQSKLHPLLALLSVLGGVSALGPIGIIVGPMVVSFLQALLNMLHLELSELDGNVESPAEPTPADQAELAT